MEGLLIMLLTLCCPPVLLLVVLVVILATFGKSLGIRRKYVQCLLWIFEWGAKQVQIARAAQINAALSPSSETEDELDGSKSTPAKSNVISQSIIKKEASDRIVAKLQATRKSSLTSRVAMVADDSLDFIKAGVESVIEDEVTSRFMAEELASWNLLTRTSATGFQYINWQMTLLYVCGMLFRYCFLLPVRLILMVIGLTFLISSTAVIGYVTDVRLKRWLNGQAMLVSNRILSRALSAIPTFHNKEHIAHNGGICVANHTSPIDVMILNCDNSYALIGQSQGGILGIIQRALNRASAHIWFERSEAGDRAAVARRIRDHVHSPDTMPILIFPEGTCINNTSVMMFKKGSFEVGATIYPAALKYDHRFCDPFWNSSLQSMGEYLLRMMTSWALVVEVWYLPPMTQEEGEDSIAFAGRCKRVIAAQGGLVDLEWDGQLKRMPVPAKMIARQQKLYSDRLGRAPSAQNTSTSSTGRTESATSPHPTIGEQELEEPFDEDEPLMTDGLEVKSAVDHHLTTHTPEPLVVHSAADTHLLQQEAATTIGATETDLLNNRQPHVLQRDDILVDGDVKKTN